MRAYLAYLRQARRDAMALDLVDPCLIVSNHSFDILRHPIVVSQILAWGVRGYARWIKDEKSCNLSGCWPLLSASPESHLAIRTQYWTTLTLGAACSVPCALRLLHLSHSSASQLALACVSGATCY